MEQNTARRLQRIAMQLQTAHPTQVPILANELNRISLTSPRGGMGQTTQGTQASSGAQDVAPVAADWHPPSLAETVQSLLACSRWLVVPSIPLLPAASISPGERLEFQFSGGLMIGMRGTAVSYDESGNPNWDSWGTEMAMAGVQMSLNNQEPLIVNGQGVDWAWYSDLFAVGVQWSPLLRRVTQGDVLNLQFRNRYPAAPAPKSLQISLTFAYLADRDLDYLTLRG